MSAYTSSVIFKYGDTDNVAKDSVTVNDIYLRQGHSFLIDIIAEVCGRSCNLFKLNAADRTRLKESILRQLQDAIEERI